MARVLAISSQVARGAIGLSAVVPALQAFGHDVIALPTIVLSNHPGHPKFAGEHVAPDLLRRMLKALDDNGWLGAVDAVFTGYLPSKEHVAFARRAVETVRAAGGGAIFMCDAILGDEPNGLYIALDAAEAIRGALVPIADIVKMNRFECGWLSGQRITTTVEAAHAARQRDWRMAIVTSLAASVPNALSNALIEDAAVRRECSVAKRDSVPKGTGDLMSGLFLGALLRGQAPALNALERAVAGVDLVVAHSAGADELQVASCLRDLAA